MLYKCKSVNHSRAALRSTLVVSSFRFGSLCTIESFPLPTDALFQNFCNFKFLPRFFHNKNGKQTTFQRRAKNPSSRKSKPRMDDDGGVTDLVATSFNDLPIEVSMDILSRLPAKTLVRFSSVRKSFYSLIRTPLFISKHLHFHSSNTSPHLILITPTKPFQRKPHVLFSATTTQTQSTQHSLYLPRPKPVLPRSWVLPTASFVSRTVTRFNTLCIFGTPRFGGTRPSRLRVFPSSWATSVLTRSLDSGFGNSLVTTGL